MQDCVETGLHQEGTLPGGMKVKRRAANIYKQLIGDIAAQTAGLPVGTLDWVNLFALAVSEGKCHRRARRYRTYQRCGGYYSCGIALLLAIL